MRKPPAERGGCTLKRELKTFQNTSKLLLICLTITGNSVTSGAGGGIYNSGGTLTVTNSTISVNSAKNGGGIENDASTVTLTNSTVSGNTASYGGGIFNSSTSTVMLTNSTVSGNSAGFEGGGIFNESTSTVTLNNSIIANSASGGDCANNSRVNASYSLIEDGLGCVNGTNSNNKVGDPNLGPLADNGGQTKTHALLTGSIAIDAGSNALVPTSITTDQRGVQRIIDGNNDRTPIVDMGSFEASAPTAAGATVSGQVTTGRRGLNKAIVYLQGLDGSMRIMRTNPFGYFQFEDVEAGQTYIVSVMSKQYQFVPQVITVNGALDNLLFTPLGTIKSGKSKDGLIP